MHTKTIWILPFLLLLSTLLAACESSESSGPSGGLSLGGSSMSETNSPRSTAALNSRHRSGTRTPAGCGPGRATSRSLRRNWRQFKGLNPPGKFRAVYNDSVARHEKMLEYARRQPADYRAPNRVWIPTDLLPTGVAPGYPGSPRAGGSYPPRPTTFCRPTGAPFTARNCFHFHT